MNYVQGTGKSRGIRTAFVLAVIALAVAGTASPAQAQVQESVLYSFPSGTNCETSPCEPGSPAGLVAQGRDGNLYGYSHTGGTNKKCTPASGCGTIYETSTAPGNTPTVIWSFASRDECQLGLTLGTDGYFYGACQIGGQYGDGYVFQFIPNGTGPGTLNTLYSFCSLSNCSDGANPSSRPIEGRDGNFYGTTLIGGTESGSGYGTVYHITSTGTLSTLYSFTDDPNLSYPYGPMYLGSNGNLYGTTQAGTDDDPPFLSCPPSCGAIYEITTAGELTVLYTFTGQPSDGATPTRGVIQGTDGNFYGSTVQGGADNVGTLFKLTPGRGVRISPSPLPPFDYSFTGTSGVYAYGIPRGLAQASNGNFYLDGSGCADGSGSGCNDYGSVFEITPQGKFSYPDAYSFSGPPNDGASPESTLSHTSGTLYGVTEEGGTDNDGALYSLNFNAPQFCRPQILAGQVGATTEILGQGFNSSSVVKFGGVPATEVGVDDCQSGQSNCTFIAVTIPTGAKTGQVTVTTGSTTLYSLQTFYVLP